MPNDKEFELDDLESFSFDDLSLDDTPPAAEADSEADPLGVWVKSAPEDVDSSGGSSSPSIEPVPLPADDGLPEEDFLSTEELANLDDSFEFVTVSEEPLTGETDLDEDMAFLDTPEAVEAERASKDSDAPSFNEVSLDDFVTFDDVSLEDDTPEAAPVIETASVEGLDSSLDEGFDEEFLDIDIDIENDIGDDELEIMEGSRPKPREQGSEPALSSQDIDIGEFVDFEEVAPSQRGPLAEGEDLPEVSDVPASAEISAEEDGFFEESVIEEPLPNMQDEGEVALDVDLEPDDHTDMDHILALEEDLTSGIRQPSEGIAAPSGSGLRQEPDLATQILGKIEQELSSIKQEISELKKEMTHFRAAPPAPAAEAALPSTEPASPEEPFEFPEPEEAAPEEETGKASHGFFDEEDDETIALTGDELDNILSTAEISEGEEVGLSLDEDLLNLDAEGNLIEPEISSEADSEDLHVTDEEFLAGTALDLNEPAFGDDSETEALLDLPEISDSEEDALPLGVPESIELEESLPLDLDDAETEDLLADDLMGEVPAEAQVAELSDSLETEVPLEDEVGLDSIESVPLTQELAEDSPLSEDWDLDALPPLGQETEELTTDFGADAEGWSAPPAELEAELEPAPAAPEAPLPPPPPVSPPASAKEGSELSASVKDELKAVLSYMDKLLASLPDDKIQEFAESEHFEVYKRLFEELGLIE